MKRFCSLLFGVLIFTGFAQAKQGVPAFHDPESVFADLRQRIDACGAAGAKCSVQCGYALKTLKNFLKANPNGDASIFEQKWQQCHDAFQNANLKLADAQPGPIDTGEKEKVTGKVVPSQAVDIQKFIIAGVPLGGEMKKIEKRIFLLEAHGYFKQPDQEYSKVVLSRGKSSPGPDIVRNYHGTIKEPNVTVHFEASGDGQVYKIQFEQKESLQPDNVTAQLVDRYGKPTRHQGKYLIWGCQQGENQGNCIKANVSERGMTIWALAEGIKTDCYGTYQQQVLSAKGVKGGAKF